MIGWQGDERAATNWLAGGVGGNEDVAALGEDVAFRVAERFEVFGFEAEVMLDPSFVEVTEGSAVGCLVWAESCGGGAGFGHFDVPIQV